MARWGWGNDVQRETYHNRQWKSLTYGKLPSSFNFEERWDVLVGPGECYSMELVEDDFVVIEEAIIEAEIPHSYYAIAEARGYKSQVMICSSFGMYEVLRALVRAWEDGEEQAGDLASGILYTFNIEWV